MNVFITGAAGFIGGSIATGLVKAGHTVTGLVRSAEQAAEMTALGITPVIGTLDDADVLTAQASKADAVINAASSDHRAAVETLLAALKGSNKPFLHTSGSSIVGDASGGKASDVIYVEDNLPEPTVDKAARVAIDNLILAAAKDGVNSAVICNTLIYGHSLGLYLLALTKNVPGTFYFVESSEAAFVDMTTAIAQALNLGEPQDWPLAEAEAEWGYEMANYGLGSNSRVRGKHARELLGWAPKRTSVVEWIRHEMV